MAEQKKLTIDELVIRAKNGDHEAYGFIYEELVKPIYRYIYYRVEPQIAEDLTEETFLKGWQHLKSYKKGKMPFRSWLFKIAHNLVCDHYRKHRTTDEMDEMVADPMEERNPAFQINVKLNQVRLRKAIRTLPEAYQQVIVLKYINELSNEEIAVTLDKNKGTVRTLQFRALEKLRSMLGKFRGDF